MAKYNFKKEDIIKNLSFSTGFSLNYSKKIINDLIEILIKNIKLGDFNLKNIGTFKITYRAIVCGETTSGNSSHGMTNTIKNCHSKYPIK